MKVRVPRRVLCACGAKWSLGVDALLHARAMEPSYRDWRGRHADCAYAIEIRRVRLPLLRQLFAWLTQPAT